MIDTSTSENERRGRAFLRGLTLAAELLEGMIRTPGMDITIGPLALEMAAKTIRELALDPDVIAKAIGDDVAEGGVTDA